MARAHLYMTIVDDEGNLQKGAEVRLLQPHTTNPITVPIYETDSGTTVIGNPWIAESGIIDVYLENPMRVRIGLQTGNSIEQYIEDIDVGGSGSGEGDFTHPGLGTNSTSVGSNAQSGGEESVALGHNSSAQGDRSTALGQQAIASQVEGTALGWHAQANADGSLSGGSESNATGSGAIALGKGALASGNLSTAIGRASVASSSSGMALGYNANASHTGSVAIGPGSLSTDSYQITLGTANHETYVRGVLVLRSSGGNDFEIRVSNEGTLYPSIPIREDMTQILPTGDTEFSGGVGGWTATGSTLSTTSDPSLSPTPVLTIDTAQSATAVSSTVSAVEGTTCVGEVWAYASGSFEMELRIEFLSSGVSDSLSTPISVPALGGQWVRLTTRGDVPPGANEMRLSLTSLAGAGDQVHVESAGLYQTS